MASYSHLVLLVFLSLIDLSKEQQQWLCDGYLQDMKNTSMTERISLISANSSKEVIECTLLKMVKGKSCSEKNLFACILSDCFEGINPNKTCGQKTAMNETIYMLHFWCLLVKLTNKSIEFKKECDGLNAEIKTVANLLDTLSHDQTSSPPATSTTSPLSTSTKYSPTTSTSPPTTSTSPLTTSTSPPTTSTSPPATSTTSPLSTSTTYSPATSTTSPPNTSTYPPNAFTTSPPTASTSPPMSTTSSPTTSSKSLPTTSSRSPSTTSISREMVSETCPLCNGKHTDSPISLGILLENKETEPWKANMIIVFLALSIICNFIQLSSCFLQRRHNTRRLESLNSPNPEFIALNPTATATEE